MAFWKRKCTLDKLVSEVVLGGVFREHSANQLVQTIQGGSSRTTDELRGEVFALRFFGCRVAIMSNLRDFKIVIDALDRRFLGAIQEENGYTNEQMAQLMDWIVSRISGYTNAYNSIRGSAGDHLMKVAFKFAEFACLDSESIARHLLEITGEASVCKAVEEYLNSVRLVLA